MSFDQKKKFIVKLICEMTNFNIEGDYCDWSTETMPLNVSKEIVISFLNRIDFAKVCNKLKGYKFVNEVLDIIFNSNDSF